MRITILGAGVSGLTTAIVLSEANHDVTILASDATNTTSAAAAAIWLPYHIASEHVDAWALETRDVLTKLADDPETTGVSLIDFDVFDEPRPRCIEHECLPVDGGGFRVRVPLADTTRYLPYLRRRFPGRVVEREVRPEEIAGLDGDLIVNCTGFGARALFGDAELEPGYGLAVIVPRPPIDRALVRSPAEDRLTYVIPRTNDCVLGGYDRPVAPAAGEAERIVERCRQAVPELSGEIRAVKPGIRPVRPSVRLERETVAGRAVIHNYGHGGAGFTVSWGCAGEVGRLVEER